MSCTFWLSSPDGIRLAVLCPLAYRYRRVVNRVGYLGLAVPYDGALLALLRPDCRIGVWRSADDGAAEYLDCDTVWLVRFIAVRRTQRDERIIELGALSANSLLDRRIVPQPPDSLAATKTGPADDLMKAIIREQFVTPTDPARTLAHLIVAPDQSAAPTLTRSFARQNVRTVLTALAAESAQAGIRLAFDIAGGDGTAPFIFNTYIGQRGIDHAGANALQPLTLGPDGGTLVAAGRAYDYSREHNVVYAGGRGTGVQRPVVTLADERRVGASPLNRHEIWLDQPHAATLDMLTGEARTQLEQGAPRRRFTGTVRSRPGCAYGRHWRWGDVVQASFEGETVACEVYAVNVSGQDNAEQITAELRSIV